jgi:hypothetical protein
VKLKGKPGGGKRSRGAVEPTASHINVWKASPLW